MEVDEMEIRLSEVKGELKDDGHMLYSTGKSSSSSNETLSRKRQREDCSDSLGDVKKAVVVLTRLPDYKISALRPPTPPQFYSEDESLSSSESDLQWEPGNDSSGSDKSKSKKTQTNGQRPKSSTSGASASVPQPSPIIISTAFGISPDETRNVRPDLPDDEITVDMMVLARKRHMRWQRGKIVEIITKEDGHVKYKVQFEEKGKSLVSGHHIAFDAIPKREQLYVGARVVVNCQDNASHFQTGIMVELPSRRNRLRFLVFTDDHVPIYVGLPLLHLVCRPLEDPLDDLRDGPHKTFMTRYLKDWPRPHLTVYKAGQSISVDLNGVEQRCEVQEIDSSLMQVVFKENQEKEWIHRGSTRLEHMRRIFSVRESEEEQQRDSSD
ncbi:histone-lysine N-methyltransferase SETDB1-B isoform X2 [Labrus bergylta]|uniref:histone-lysine N-methyltransferase SETDB1-B isoform X2 n=1 Tax=Labrus bergylta TaxID=56723 RepID=UPI0009B3DA92|nr:histone-lysine N-methyltransferase SETDB1-B-like isoform X2 [Labrus bergylta]